MVRILLVRIGRRILCVLHPKDKLPSRWKSGKKWVFSLIPMWNLESRGIPFASKKPGFNPGAAAI